MSHDKPDGTGSEIHEETEATTGQEPGKRQKIASFSPKCAYGEPSALSEPGGKDRGRWPGRSSGEGSARDGLQESRG